MERENKIPHPHAESMKLYAQDAAQTSTPWKRWQYKDVLSRLAWSDLSGHPQWNVAVEYRRKPSKMRYYRPHSFPRPEVEAPPIGTIYYIPLPLYDEVFHDTWDGYAADRRRLSAGVVHLTEKAAKEHLNAMKQWVDVDGR